jgi:hypothetical protein
MGGLGELGTWRIGIINEYPKFRCLLLAPEILNDEDVGCFVSVSEMINLEAHSRLHGRFESIAYHLLFLI